MHDRKEAPIGQRIIALIGCPFYLVLLTGAFSQVTHTSIVLTALVVIGCAILVLTAIGILCVRFAARKEHGNQFGMATALLLFVPFAVYFGAIRCLVMSVELEPIEPSMWVPLGVFCLMFMVVTTVVLLFFGEAIVWLAVSVRIALRGRVDDGLQERIDDARGE